MTLPQHILDAMELLEWSESKQPRARSAAEQMDEAVFDEISSHCITAIMNHAKECAQKTVRSVTVDAKTYRSDLL